MATQNLLPLRCADALEINDVVCREASGDRIAYFAGATPTFTHAKGDRLGARIATTQLLNTRLATPTELSMGLGMDRKTLYRQLERLRAEGLSGLVWQKRGPKEGRTLKGGRLVRAQRTLDAGQSIREAARIAGVDESTIRNAIERGRLALQTPRRAGRPPQAIGSQPGERNAKDAAGALGVATKRVIERALAAAGKLQEAPPEFRASLAVTNGGALLAVPALVELGLFTAAEKTYGRLKDGFYGLRSTIACLAIMALLRIRTPERMSFEAQGELGILLGLDRAPEVKTIRRKLDELARRGQASQLSAYLAERWVQTQPREAGLLYVDGHVRPYHGEKHRLTKTHVARRNLSMPATTDYWVNDKKAEPLFVVTGPINERLISAMKGRILPEVRRLVGPKRRVTMVFDREGWSPEWFKELDAQGFDVLSYRKGSYAQWPLSCFQLIRGQVEGRKVEYELAEKEAVRMCPGFKMREVRRLRSDGKQTAVLTTRKKMPVLQVAWRMFERWRQENFFRYMREHFALDALVDRKVEAVEAGRTIPNPKRRKFDKELTKLRAELRGLAGEYGQRALDNRESQRPTARGFKIANGELGRHIRDLRTQYDEVLALRRKEPKRIAVEDMDEDNRVVQLSPEAKHLTDTIKMAAYRAETALAALLSSSYARSDEERRALVREMLRAPADILPEETTGLLRVRIHGLANSRSNSAMERLCASLNDAHVRYPGTRLRLRYELTCGA